MSLNLDREVQELEERVLKYCDDILTGKQKAGQKTIWAVVRFLKDLKECEGDSKYYADWLEVVKFVRWAKMFKHTKGAIAGQRIILTDFQIFIAAGIFLFKHRGSGYRKVREVYIQLGRKNAKSQLIAIISSYIAFLSKEEEEIYVTCWTREQSNLVYGQTLSQINPVPMLDKKFTSTNGQIKVLKNGSVIKPLSREARKTGDGSNPSVAILDEYKDNQTSELYDVQKTGMTARTQPLLIVITTAGFDLDYPCYSDYQYYSRILNPEIDVENDNIFIAIYELDADDDIKDESNWVKANPLLATYEEGINALRDGLKIALDQPDRMRGYLTKNMNLWVDSKIDGYLELKKWNACKTDEYPDISDWNVYLGIDLSMTTDLTSVGWVAVKDGRFVVGQHSFMPADKYKERMSKDKVRYDMFIEQGNLTVTDGSIVDYREVMDYVVSLTQKWNVIQCGFDKWNATHMAMNLIEKGINMVEIPQSISQLSLPTKEFREAVYSGKIEHNGDGLLQWAVNNAMLKSDEQENIMIGKSASTDRIDPLAATINAFARAMYDDNTQNLEAYILSDDFGF